MDWIHLAEDRGQCGGGGAAVKMAKNHLVP